MIGLAILQFATDGFRLPGDALDILQGSDSYPAATNFGTRAIKFWLATLFAIVLPVGALAMLAPLKIARAAALIMAIIAGAWWFAVLGHEIYNPIDRGRGFPPLFHLLKISLFLGLTSIIPTAAAYLLLRK